MIQEMLFDAYYAISKKLLYLDVTMGDVSRFDDLKLGRQILTLIIILG